MLQIKIFILLTPNPLLKLNKIEIKIFLVTQYCHFSLDASTSLNIPMVDRNERGSKQHLTEPRPKIKSHMPCYTSINT